MKADVVCSAVKQDGHGLLGGPDGFVVIDHFHTLRFVLGLENEEFGGAVAYGEVLFHSGLLLGEFLVHLEEAGDDVGFGGVLGEAVSFKDGGVVGAVGLAEFGRHHSLVI